MIRPTPSLAALVAIIFLTGCSRPLHSDMSFGEIRTAVRSEFSIGMEYQETVVGLKELNLSFRTDYNYDEQIHSRLHIVASVPPKGFTTPLDWSRSSIGQIRFYLDTNDQLRSVMYHAPYTKRKRSGGWWSDDPVLIIGETS